MVVLLNILWKPCIFSEFFNKVQNHSIFFIYTRQPQLVFDISKQLNILLCGYSSHVHI